MMKDHPKWWDVPLASLYPPDHWLYDEKEYNARLCQEFEEDGWQWSWYGGALKVSHRPKSYYRPPPPDLEAATKDADRLLLHARDDSLLAGMVLKLFVGILVFLFALSTCEIQMTN